MQLLQHTFRQQFQLQQIGTLKSYTNNSGIRQVWLLFFTTYCKLLATYMQTWMAKEIRLQLYTIQKITLSQSTAIDLSFQYTCHAYTRDVYTVNFSHYIQMIAITTPVIRPLQFSTIQYNHVSILTVFKKVFINFIFQITWNAISWQKFIYRLTVSID